MGDAEADEAPRPSGLRVLSDRNFWPYFAGNLTSNCGTWFQNLAQALLIYRLTHSTLLVGITSFSQFVGTFVLASVAGGAADRFDRRKLLIVMQIGSFLVTAALAALAAAGAATAPVIIGLALLLGVGTAFSIPALQALVPLLVPTHELAGAIALNAVTFNLARAIGPLLGAVVVSQAGIPTAFAINACSYLALVVALLVVHPRPQAPRPATKPRLRESIALVRADPLLLGLLLAVLSLSLTADPVTTLTPEFVTRVFHHGDSLVGVLVGAFGCGSVLAAFTIVGRATPDPVRRVAATLGVLALGMAAFSLSPTISFAIPALLVGGFGFLASNTTATTAIQLGVDDSQRGRVMALWSVAFLGFRPFGSLVDGGVADVFGPRAAALLMTLPALGVAVYLARRRRRDPVAPPPIDVTA